jgi:hypothetical protein
MPLVRVLSLAVAVTALSLAGTSAVVGQDGVAWVSGRVTCSLVAPGTMEGTTIFNAVRGQSYSCTVDVNDPRLKGSGQHTLEADLYRATLGSLIGGPAWGDLSVEGPDGSWTGPWFGIADREGGIEATGWLAGSEAYDGWTYIYSMSLGADGGGRLAGLVYQGAPPAAAPPASGEPAPGGLPSPSVEPSPAVAG